MCSIANAASSGAKSRAVDVGLVHEAGEPVLLHAEALGQLGRLTVLCGWLELGEGAAAPVSCADPFDQRVIVVGGVVFVVLMAWSPA